MADVANDPRPDLFAAADWLGEVVRGTKPGQLGDPTPCEGWTVRDLLTHCVQVVRMTVGLAGGQAAEPVSDDVPADGWAALYDAANAGLRPVLADPAVLTRTVTTPHRGEMLCGDFLTRFISEFLVHGWDLATATGQPAEGPLDVAERALARAQETHPAQGRQTPAFADVVEVATDAGPTRRLAGWMGR